MTAESRNARVGWWLLWDLFVPPQDQSCPPPSKKPSLALHPFFTVVTGQPVYGGRPDSLEEMRPQAQTCLV